LQNMEIDDDQLVAAKNLADLAYKEGPVPCENDPDFWFPEKSADTLPGYANLHNTAPIAKELCNTQCPIVLMCRAHALKHHEMTGVWGGMSYLDRKLVWSRQHREMR
jgi:hypothetical protein